MRLILMHKHLLAFCLVASMCLFSGCEPEIEPLADAPAGTLTIGTVANEVGTAIAAKPGGGFLAAISVDADDWDAEILDLDPNGNILDRKKFEIAEEDEVIRNIKARAGGGYLATSIVMPSDNNVTKIRLRVLDAGLGVSSTIEVGELQSGAVYSNSPKSSHAEAFEMPSGGWIVTAHFGILQKVFRVDQNGDVVAERVAGSDFYFPSFPWHFYAQQNGGTVMHLEVEQNYPDVSIILESLDDFGYVDNALEIPVDSFSEQGGLYSFYIAALDIHENGRFVATAYQDYGDQFLFEFDGTTGQVLWVQAIATQQHYHLLAHDSQGNQYFAGNNPSNLYGQAEETDCTIGMVDSLGGNLTRRTIGGRYSENLMGMAVGADGKVVAIGSTSSYGAGGIDAFLVFYP